MSSTLTKPSSTTHIHCSNRCRYLDGESCVDFIDALHYDGAIRQIQSVYEAYRIAQEEHARVCVLIRGKRGFKFTPGDMLLVEKCKAQTEKAQGVIDCYEEFLCDNCICFILNQK